MSYPRACPVFRWDAPFGPEDWHVQVVGSTPHQLDLVCWRGCRHRVGKSMASLFTPLNDAARDLLAALRAEVES